MESGPHLQAPDALHETLRGLIAEMLRANPEELVPMLNALFGLQLPHDALLSSLTPAVLARRVESAWFDGGETQEELAERLAALVEDD